MQGRVSTFLSLKKVEKNRKDPVSNLGAREMVVTQRAIKGDRIRLIDLFCAGELSRTGEYLIRMYKTE